jgi:hypothetical protein
MENQEFYYNVYLQISVKCAILSSGDYKQGVAAGDFLHIKSMKKE